MLLNLPDPKDCLSLVECSPAAVAAHDKQAWLDLFASYNIVEDPVGSRPHLSGVYDARESRRGFGPLSRFYDTFIAPNTICFDVQRDIVCGLHVVRDLSLSITMAPGLVVNTPMHLRYELCQQQGQLKIFRLAAHWELWPALQQQMNGGKGSARVGMAAGWRMLRQLGPGGVAGFMGALSSVGDKGKDQVQRFAEYFNQRSPAIVELFASASVPIRFAAQERTISPEELATEQGVISLSKLLAAGNYVTASCCLTIEDVDYCGVVFFEFDKRQLAIVDVAFYLAA